MIEENSIQTKPSDNIIESPDLEEKNVSENTLIVENSSETNSSNDIPNKKVSDEGVLKN